VRLVHVVPAISQEASGPSYSVARLCESLIVLGHSLQLGTLDWSPMAKQPEFLNRFPLGLGPKRLGRSPKLRTWLNSGGAAGSIDILHNHSLWMMPNVYPGAVASKYSIPLVCSPRGTLSADAMRHGSLAKKIFWPAIQKPALAAVACFHATAASEVADIRRMGFRQPIAFIPNGIDLPADRRKKVEKHDRTLLFLGRIHPIKGLDLLLPAWKALQNRYPQWNLRIAGPDNEGYLAQVKQRATEFRLERIEFPGPLYGPEKWAAYGKADLFILPSHSENFGITVAEALASGTPAIVCKGAPWQGLHAHNAGWWVENSSEALIAAMQLALDLPHETLFGMGQNGRHWMAADFAWPGVSKQMAQTYQWLRDGGEAPPFVQLS
jgi:glycosyltransferase involved in cell wall biosynthesis